MNSIRGNLIEKIIKDTFNLYPETYYLKLQEELNKNLNFETQVSGYKFLNFLSEKGYNFSTISVFFKNENDNISVVNMTIQINKQHLREIKLKRILDENRK